MPKKFFVIGKVPGYNKIISKKINYEDKLVPHLTFVDLYPRTLIFNQGVKNIKTFINDVLTYADADHPMKYFNQVMQKHKQYLDSYNPAAGYDGIRLIATVDSAINNSISHTYESNILDQALTGSLNTISQLADQNKYTKAIKNAAQMATNLNTIYKMLSGKQYDPNRDLSELSALMDAFSGYRIHMPKMWTQTNVQDILQLSVKLTSPSGDPKAIKRYIVEPLIIIFIMSSPLSVTGTDLGTPFIYEVDAHGMGHYKLAGISNINFDRGGTDVDFNIYQQPLTVNVRITLIPLAQDAVTGLKGPSFYQSAWFQTPDTIARSLAPSNELANIAKKTYK